MGIADRHYYRDDHASPMRRGGAFGRGGMSALSVTTWLIIICVSIFVIDGFLPLRLVETDNLYPIQLRQVDSTLLQTVPRQTPVMFPDAVKRLPGSLWAVVLERSTGQQVGIREVMPMSFLQSYLHFSTALGFLRIEYWRFIGFQFLHADTMHLLFNMLGLFFLGPIAEQHLGRKRYLAFYLLCGIFGAIMYLLLNLGGSIATMMSHEQVRLPGLIFTDPYTPLIGASAGVFGVIMAGAYLAPRAQVLVFFILPIQLRTLAYLLVAIAFYTVLTGGRNAGGEAGHLGGAIAGFYFIRNAHHLHGFFDLLGRADPTSRHYRKRKQGRATPVPAPQRDEIDRILQKIHEGGVQSLTEHEKRILREASRE